MPARLTYLFSALWMAAGLLAGLAAAPAHAEKADREKPVNIEADKMFYDDLRQVNIFEGNVTLTQGTLIIRTTRLTVRQDPEGFQHGTAERGADGLAYFRQKRDNVDEYIEGWGERIEYDAKTEKATLITRAYIKRGSDAVSGTTINYDGRSEFYTVIGGKQGANPNNPDGRVRATLQPGKPAGSEAAPTGSAPGKGSEGAGAGAGAGIGLKSSGGIVAPAKPPEAPKK